jgi:hypothetical protein
MRRGTERGVVSTALARGAVALMASLAFAAVGCSTYRDDLARSQKAYEQNQHERALALFRMLEPDIRLLSDSERAQYAFLRGMTDYRIGYRADARHWLMLAKALEVMTPNSLAVDWKARLDEALGELNEAVYSGGTEALTNTMKRADEPPPKPPGKKTEDEP